MCQRQAECPQARPRDNGVSGILNARSGFAMNRNVLWIDDNEEHRLAAQRMLSGLDGVSLWTVPSSAEAERILEEKDVHCIVTDILRRDPNGGVSDDDGYLFFKSVIRPRMPTVPVIFHTKNLPGSFDVDRWSQYLSKWESERKKSIELESRISAVVSLYDAFADLSSWRKIEPRLVTVQASILEALRDSGDIMKMTPNEFEQLVAELLQRL